MEDDGNYNHQPWTGRTWQGFDLPQADQEDYGYRPEEPSPEYDGALTKRDKRNLWIFAGLVVATVAICCGAGIAVGVFLA